MKHILPRAAGIALLATALAASGCVALPTSRNGVTVVVTRLMARFEGVLLERDGCYFAGSEHLTIAWPPEFSIERRGDILRVTGGWGKGEVWDLPIGGKIVTGGGWVSIPEDKLAEFRVLPNCPREEFLVFGGAASEFQVTPEP
jgi:hypothetical protein